MRGRGVGLKWTRTECKKDQAWVNPKLGGGRFSQRREDSGGRRNGGAIQAKAQARGRDVGKAVV